jgi:molybdate transport system substrate-binding protein
MVTNEKRSGRALLVAVTLALASVAGATARAADITVSAAASLTNVFQEIGREFERANPGARVLFNFGASGPLLQQIARGAPVDAFAAADQESMDRAQRQDLIERGSRFDFTRNRLVLAVPVSSAATVASLEDLRRSAVRRIAIGNPESVPAGRYARLALDKAGLWEPLKPKLINTQNVRQALDYVARGETDAAFVYASDAQMMPARVRVAAQVDVPADILYPVAAVKGGGNARGGAQFVAFLKTETARRILARHGFLEP